MNEAMLVLTSDKCWCETCGERGDNYIGLLFSSLIPKLQTNLVQIAFSSVCEEKHVLDEQSGNVTK